MLTVVDFPAWLTSLASLIVAAAVVLVLGSGLAAAISHGVRDFLFARLAGRLY
jgi:hypothetical protein